jgi:hypothetical protein
MVQTLQSRFNLLCILNLSKLQTTLKPVQTLLIFELVQIQANFEPQNVRTLVILEPVQIIHAFEPGQRPACLDKDQTAGYYGHIGSPKLARTVYWE